MNEIPLFPLVGDSYSHDLGGTRTARRHFDRSLPRQIVATETMALR